MKAERGEFSITSDPSAVDLAAVHAFLTRVYWSEGVPVEVVARAIAGSIPFSLFHGSTQIGFARAITDRATYAYLADVYVLEEHRGCGLSKAMLAHLHARPDLQGLRRWLLFTRDAHSLYEQFGWTGLAHPERAMLQDHPDIYQ